MSVALNPKRLENPKPEPLKIGEAVAPVPIGQLVFVDLKETSNLYQKAVEKTLEINAHLERQESKETEELKRLVAELSIIINQMWMAQQRIEQKVDQTWQQVSKDSEKRTQAYEAIIRELNK